MLIKKPVKSCYKVTLRSPILRLLNATKNKAVLNWRNTWGEERGNLINSWSIFSTKHLTAAKAVGRLEWAPVHHSFTADKFWYTCIYPDVLPPHLLLQTCSNCNLTSEFNVLIFSVMHQYWYLWGRRDLSQTLLQQLYSHYYLLINGLRH